MAKTIRVAMAYASGFAWGYTKTNLAYRFKFFRKYTRVTDKEFYAMLEGHPAQALFKSLMDARTQLKLLNVKTKYIDKQINSFKDRWVGY